MFILRHYQQEAVDRAVDHLRSKVTLPALMVLPTGSGKSLIIANIAKRLNAPVLVLQPSKEILEQNLFKYVSYGEYAAVYSASMKRKDISEVTFATIGSIYKNPDIFRQFQYIIIDECHKVSSEKKPKKGETKEQATGGMYRKFLDALGTHNILGLTATPYRLASNGRGSELRLLTRTRPAIFKSILYNVQTRTLFDEGFLSPVQYHQLANFNRSKIQRNKTGGDYDEKSLKAYYGAIDFLGGVVKVTNRLLERERKSILIFTRFIEEARHLAENIPGAVYITGQTEKKERERILRDFKRGKIKVVCNVGVLTIGFDYPELDTIVIARPTLSLALYYQMIGRVLRPHASKSAAWVVDMCENINFFGKIEDLELKDMDTRTPYFKGTYGILTNVPLARDVSRAA